MTIANSLIGKNAPNFSAHSTRGIIDLEAYEGSWVLLFCHPADFTPVCTTEFISLAKKKEEFDSLGVELIGLSVDSIYSHMNWLEWIEDNFGQHIPFPVIEDSSMEISKAYHMIDETSQSTATVRACIFIDPEQVVQAVIHYPMQVGRSIDEILRVQKALIETHDQEIAVPANWQPGQKIIETPLDRMMNKPAGWLKKVLSNVL